jgi:hypothetical protein
MLRTCFICDGKLNKINAPIERLRELASDHCFVQRFCQHHMNLAIEMDMAWLYDFCLRNDGLAAGIFPAISFSEARLCFSGT